MAAISSSIVRENFTASTASVDSDAGADVACPRCARRWPWWKRWLVRFAVLIVLLGGLYVFRAQLLTLAAELWVVNEPLQRADAIVVLGGGASSRPAEAARLYHQGYAPKVLIMTSPSTSAAPGEAAPDQQALLQNKVPESAIIDVGERVTSTFEEARAVYKWAETSGVKRLIVPSTIFHTRRMHWVFEKQLKPLKIDVVVTAIPTPEYRASNWWKSEEGLLNFNNEVVKMIYYVLNY